MFKKVAAFTLATALILGVSTPQINFAEEGIVKKDKFDKEAYNSKEEVKLAKKLQKMSEKEIKKEQKSLSKQIKGLTDSELDRFMFNFVKDNYQSDEQMTENLKLLDIEFAKKKKGKDKQVSITGMNPADIDLSIFSYKRGTEGWYSIQSNWETFGGELSIGTLDLVSIEWDPNVGNYYTVAVPDDRITTKKDGTNRLNGIYLFNVRDAFFNFDSYAVVRVTPKKFNTKFHYATKYTHTFSVTDTSSTGSSSFQFTNSGFTAGYSYSVTKQTGIDDWDIFDDNDVTF
ncbi:hypothetical protein [Chengkuizengella marina]|uniref:Uncharacterized protein n=1 Tax=Chengkuizengella marina TaxID=2507566 RepID=A0A6N9Q1W5_9BACL|nr:hypothetical protein [Chengkuizengella marina]NBI28204.1 hypothetical protein [Chengkuizengella marina]